MADEHRNAHRATDQVSTKIQLEGRLADLKQLLETNPALSSEEAGQVVVYEVKLPIIAS